MKKHRALLQLLPAICRTTPAQIRVLETQLAQLRSQAAEVEDKRTKLQQRQSAALDALSASTGRKLPVGQNALNECGCVVSVCVCLSLVVCQMLLYPAWFGHASLLNVALLFCFWLLMCVSCRA